MKSRCLIGFVLLALVACAPSVKDVDLVGTPSPELSAVDSLMWRQPDSALMCLIPYFDTCCRDARFHVSTTTEYNRHYANLLLAELLYKNDYPQTNRTNLLQAVAYFDSLNQTVDDNPHPLCRHCGFDPQSHIQHDILAFLDAHAHYINGVGYYENDSVMEACGAYLKALEIMEDYFREKELVGKKAKFMTYIYNRLGDLFSEQFMLDPAIACYENAFVYCRIEPTSPQGVSKILYRIGQQYDMKGEKEKAREYYGKAIEEMPSCDNLSYRDLVSIKALSDYRVGQGIEQSLIALRKIITQTKDKREQLSRFLTVGDLFFEERMYDSAMFYLESVFFYSEDKLSQIQAAEHLMTIYDSFGDREKSNECMRFLAQQKKTEGQSKVLVSLLEGLFKTYTDRKQAEEEWEKAVKKVVNIVVPIAVVVVIVIIIMARLRGKKQLRQQQVEAYKVLEETGKTHKAALEQQEKEARKAMEKVEKQHEQELIRQRAKAIENERTHKIQQSALSSRLKRSNEELRELKDQMKIQTNGMAKKETVHATSFSEEPICRLVMERVKEGQFKSQMDCILYKDYSLDKDQIAALREVVDYHFTQFTIRLKKAYPELTHADLDYCCLYMLGLSDADISALMQKAYPTVSQRSRKIKAILGSGAPLSTTLNSFVDGNLLH